MNTNLTPVPAETADAMHATITGLMRDNERLRAALQSILQCIDDGSGAFQLGRRAVAARAALKGAA